MTLKLELCFEDSAGVIVPRLHPTGDPGEVPTEEALNRLRLCSSEPGSIDDVMREFGDMCMTWCTVCCLVSIMVMSFLNRLGQSMISTVLSAVYGFIFLAVIMHILNAKVSGFTDRAGTVVSFKDGSITFAGGEQYYFQRGRWY